MSGASAAQVLVIDDEEDHAEVMGEVLKRMGHVCTLVHTLPAAVDELKHGAFDLIVTDLVMDAQDDGLRVLEAARAGQSDAAVVMVTAHGDVPTAKAALRGGAYDFIEKPLDLDVFRTLCGNAIEAVFLRTQNRELKREVEGARGFEGMLGTSAAIRALANQVEQVAPAPLPVLVTGESGTGKELVARAIHSRSKRSGKPFVPINCAGLSESILEDELFGHVRGAFTGAEKDRQGRFEYASGGTMFLDEIGDMPKPMQAKLLRVLESGEVVRLGSNEPRHVDVRLVSATNAGLEAMVKEGAFREDLYFRIKGMELHLPPLRARREDVPLLVRHFLAKFAHELGKPVPEVARDTMGLLSGYGWPGNVRQLINVTQNALVMCDGPVLEPKHLPPEVRLTDGDVPENAESLGGEAPLKLDQLEKHAIRNALRVAEGNREQAAEMLGIGERTLYRKLKEYGVK
ncbi:sigma-54-dependent transcriptional regulator [Phycisphaera mikurensis]|uniref:Putative NtrC family two-component system response regulator n=1 Tax=Phycisphaera mikurensis (strain NBRC 102666 / KCTC 22515 / FYK2301M01) TaxID=1142394 RepID=I0IF68_PHYMF|nr:sigma-54 dependent transcriptional regulator [Phycisphaera mikurensis]MBB6440698.1 two-component system response regulator HydG [Phycisphaera mikurensis]BAM03906.1 putative NtrC family two-component system response regulator [Phycisphaera mikurensis NBRC 102666]